MPASVAAPDKAARDAAGRARVAFFVALTLVGACKLWIAARLAPFGDEAFYWQESRHLAWAYSDLPGLTAWLIALGERLFGHSTLAMRAPFLLLGTLIPLLIVALARQAGADARAGWQAGLWALALPLLGTLGVLALPDVALTFASLLALLAFARALRGDRWRDWIGLGGALALAWLCHYRAAVLMLCGLVYLVAMPAGRALWRRPGLWAALALSLLGLAPLLAFNAMHEWRGLGFQLVERHPWSFHADALVQPLEQALVVTPVLYALLLAAAWASWRRRGRGAPWDLFAVCAIVPLLAFFAFGLFADEQRFRLHWPLPGYLPLLALLPLLAEEWRGRPLSRWLPAGAALAAIGCAATLAYLVAASVPGMAAGLSGLKAFPSHFVGWNEAAAHLRALREREDLAGLPLVADNFMLAAELGFALDRADVPALDSPLNTKHGRAAQLALWRLDESGLAPGQTVLLVVDETALRERDRAAWRAELCRRLDRLEPLDRLDLYGGRKRYLYYRAEVPAPGSAHEGCAPDGE